MKHLQTIWQNRREGIWLATAALVPWMAAAQSPQFSVSDLGLVGSAGQPFVLTNNSLVSGAAGVGTSVHAVLWYQGRKIDIGAPLNPGQNSMAFGVNERGQAVGEVQTLGHDSLGEDFCGFAELGLSSSGGACVPFLWQNGVIKPLPTLGGNNGAANQINNRGDIAGMAEIATPDSACPSDGRQRLQFKPALWRNGNVQELRTWPGDADGIAFAINDSGQVAGTSGGCVEFNPIALATLQPLHALLWEDGKATDLGTLGGTGHGNGIEAANLNNRGQVVGNSDLAGDTAFHAFLWARETGMKDLGALAGDVSSAATSINDAGQVVGISLDSEFNPRAFLRQGEKLLDLNELVPADSPLYLITACSINARGEIIGIGIDKDTGDVHAYLAVPAPGRNSVANSPAADRSALPRPLKFAMHRR